MSMLYKPKKEIKWTLEKVSEGFRRFYEEHDRYPTAHDVDDFEYLPSSRQIQRSFGGLVSLRNQLGLTVENYTKGKERSITSSDINKKGKSYELLTYELLRNNFEDVFIHIERPVNISSNMNSKDRFDFYVYARPNNFAVDVFGTEDIRNFINIMNIKENKYKKSLGEGERLYFVYFSNIDLKNKINKWLSRRKKRMPTSWKILSFHELKGVIKKYNAFY